MKASDRFENDLGWGRWAENYIAEFFRRIAKNHIYQMNMKSPGICCLGISERR